MCYSNEEIKKIIDENGIEFIRMQFTDIAGQLKNVAITKRHIDRAFDNKIMFDGSSIEGFSRIEESDMYLRPSTETFAVLPWRPKGKAVARMICDVYTPEGYPFEGDPRYRLKKITEELEDMGYIFNVGAEMEFFLFHTDENGCPTNITHDSSSYFDLEPIDLGGEVRREIVLELEDMGFDIETSHHEVARGQHEVDFSYSDAVSTADNIMTFKNAVRAIAKKNGLFASFMPKPLQDTNGSGMHINMSLEKDGKNCFYDPNDEKGNGLSKEAYWFIGGIIKHVKGLTAITNPLINSYKRLVPGFEAPVNIAWSCKNRSPLIRIPASRGSSTRIELRSPDPSANPYLALTVCLAAGIDGIKNKIEPPKEIKGNVFEMSQREMEQTGTDRLPYSLENALLYLSEDEVIKEAIGEHTYKKFMDIKKDEIERFMIKVHPWEIDEYLTC